MNPIVYEKTNPIARGSEVMGLSMYPPTKDGLLHPQQRIGTLDFLNDRNVFNQVSQTQEQIDFSPTSPQDYEIGMRMSGTSMRNNKKSLINNPYIGGNQGIATATMPTDTDDANGFASTTYSSLLSTSNEQDDFPQCPIEREMIIHEFTENLKRTRTAINNILFDVTSPFAKTYMWKALILLANNPYNEQLTAMIDGNKDGILLDMKKTAPYMAEQGIVTVTIPQKTETFNTNIITKFEEIYKIKIKMLREAKVASIFLQFSFSLKIPQIYKPYESHFQLLGLNERIKSVVLTNALCAMSQYHDAPHVLSINSNHDLFCLEIQMGENMVLGFAYTIGQTIIGTIPVEFINQDKPFTYTIGKLVIPKLNKKRVKQNEESLANVHFRDLCHGNLQTVVMGSSIEFSFGVCQEEFVVGKGNKLIGEVAVNHPCFYYVKNGKLKNKLLVAGLIHY
jgi:hypothetical protein